MAKPLVFQFGDHELALSMTKVDRSKLYGSKETLALDEEGAVCELATLADDGRTIIGKGGTGLIWLDADGRSREKSELKPVDLNGDEITPVKSSFGTTIKLFDTASPSEYLEHTIRLVYQLQPAGEESSGLTELCEELNQGTIFTFPYSYRGGLEADAAFLLTNSEDELMMAVGSPTKCEFVGIESSAPVATEDEADDSDDDLMDFDMI